MRNIPPNLPTAKTGDRRHDDNGPWRRVPVSEKYAPYRVVRRVLLPLDELDHDAFGPEDESEAQARVVEICDPNGFHIELRQWFR